VKTEKKVGMAYTPEKMNCTTGVGERDARDKESTLKK